MSVGTSGMGAWFDEVLFGGACCAGQAHAARQRRRYEKKGRMRRRFPEEWYAGTIVAVPVAQKESTVPARSERNEVRVDVSTIVAMAAVGGRADISGPFCSRLYYS